jgi:D-xylose transport system substrate-binding protein
MISAVVAALALAACGGESAEDEVTDAAAEATDDGSDTEGDESPDDDAGEGGAYTIGFLLPETAVARYETKDRPYFEAELERICPECELLYANANGDQAAQQQQATSMIAQGVDVLVVDPFDGVAAASIVEAAQAEDIPVVAYDRLISSPDLTFLVTNDYYAVGVLQGETLIAKLEADGISPEDGGILMMNGAETDDNAFAIRDGALSVIEPSGYEILASIATWDPAEAQNWVSSQLTQFGPEEIVAIYSANDANAQGALAALRAGGVDPIPPMTGLDADLTAIQRILVAEQYMTVYNAFRTEAELAANVAYELAQGNTPEADTEIEGVPAKLNPPQAVTIETIADTVVADEFWTIEEICTADYADACSAAGLS